MKALGTVLALPLWGRLHFADRRPQARIAGGGWWPRSQGGQRGWDQNGGPGEIWAGPLSADPTSLALIVLLQ